MMDDPEAPTMMGLLESIRDTADELLKYETGLLGAASEYKQFLAEGIVDEGIEVAKRLGSKREDWGE